MKPILFHLGPIVIRSWGVLVASGILAGLYFARRFAAEKNVDVEKILSLTFYLILFGLIGGRVIFVLLELPYFMSNPAEILMVQLGGLSIQGAILGGFLAAYFFCRYHKLSLAQISDVFAPSLLLGQAIGRIGCFLNGDSYGKVTNFFLRVKFLEVEGLRHPVQLYESGLDFLAFGFVWFFLRDKFKKDGMLFAVVIIIYSLVRFTVEFVRDSEILALGLSYAQIAALATVLVFGIVLTKKQFKLS